MDAKEALQRETIERIFLLVLRTEVLRRVQRKLPKNLQSTCDMPMPSFDLEAYLGEAWFAQQSAELQVDARRVLREIAPTMYKHIGMATMRMLLE